MKRPTQARSETILVWARAALFLEVVLFIPGLTGQFEPPKAEVVRVAGLALIPLGAAALGRRRAFARQPLDLAVLAWLASEALSTAFSGSPRISVVGDPEQREGLLTSLGLAGFYGVIRLATGDDRAARKTLVVAVTAGSVASVYALLQAAHLDPVPWTHTATYGTGGIATRPPGTLGHPNLLGVVTGALAAAAAVMALFAAGRRLFWGATAVLLVAATLFSLSRAAWLGLAAGSVLGLGLAWRARSAPRLSARAIGVALLLIAALVTLTLLSGWGHLLVARFSELLSPASGSARSRLEIWASALAMWRARPALGWGPDCFSLVFPQFQTPDYWRWEWRGLPVHAHNIYLHALATRGALGLLAGVAWGAGLVAAARRAWHVEGDARVLTAALLAALLSGAVAGTFGALGMAGALGGVALSASLVALAESAGTHPPRGSQSNPRRRARSPAEFAPQAAAVVLGGCALVWAFAELGASRDAAQSQAWMSRAGTESGEASRRDMAVSAALAERALRRSPWDDSLARLAAEGRLGLADLSPEPEAALRQAESAARRAVAMEPRRALNHQVLGGVLAARVRRGQAPWPAARDELERSIRLAPRNALGLQQLIGGELAWGRPRDALPPARRLVQLYPDDAMGRFSLATVLLALGQTAAARQELERALAADWRGQEAARDAARELRERLR